MKRKCTSLIGDDFDAQDETDMKLKEGLQSYVQETLDGFEEEMVDGRTGLRTGLWTPLSALTIVRKLKKRFKSLVTDG